MGFEILSTDKCVIGTVGEIELISLTSLYSCGTDRNMAVLTELKLNPDLMMDYFSRGCFHPLAQTKPFHVKISDSELLQYCWLVIIANQFTIVVYESKVSS